MIDITSILTGERTIDDLVDDYRAEVEKALKSDKKYKDAKDILDLILSYVSTYYPDILEDPDKKEVTKEEVDELISELDKFADTIRSFQETPKNKKESSLDDRLKELISMLQLY